MISVKARNIAGIVKADLEIEAGEIALVSGLNGAGKSSLVQAVRAALTGSAMIRDVSKKKDAEALVHDGAPAGRVVVMTEGGSTEVRWPACEVESQGRAPTASAVTAGAVRFAMLPVADRSRALVRLLGAEPTKDDLAGALDGLKPETIDKLWEKIEASGWDATHDDLRKRGTGLKARWEKVTGENWGSAKAENWTPRDFDYDQKRDYDAEVEHARGVLETAISEEALSENRRTELDAQVTAGKDAAKRAEKLSATLDDLHVELEKAIAERQGVPDATSSDAQPACPWCAKPLRLRQEKPGVHKLEKGSEEKVSDDELKKRRHAVATADGKIANAKDRISTATAEITEAKRLANLGGAAARELEAASSRRVGSDTVTQARNKLAEAEAAANLFHKMQDASAERIAVGKNQKMIDATGPGGIRLVKLKNKIESFNATIAELAGYFGLSSTGVDEDMVIRAGGRLYPLLSESEQWRVDLVFQCAFAKAGGCDLLLVDRADILHPQARPGLLKLLRSMGMPVLAAMTSKEVGALPNLAQAGFGRVYWLEDGTLSPTER